MNNIKCVCCGVKWRDRANTLYESGATSTSFVYTMRLLSDIKGNQIELPFCDLHANNLRTVTKYVNGVFKIKNINTGKWRKAINLGVTV